MLLEVTNRFHLQLLQRMKWQPKTFDTTPRARHTVMRVTVQCHREKVPSWKYHGIQEDDVSSRSQGVQGVPHRDFSYLPKSSWEAVGSFDAPS